MVVFGGDGTVNEVISGIDERDYIPKLGIIPGGTGNLITKLLEINQDIDGAIDELDFDLTNKIDIGKANDNYFGFNIFKVFFCFILQLFFVIQSLLATRSRVDNYHYFFH
ncbi:sphingosine kinase [Streptococcus pneumoniae]|nr:sphingosine kinase [Streptococcus pneumoniae]